MKKFIILLVLLISIPAFGFPPRRQSVSDEAYNATTWDKATTVAPSKHAVRDKIETLAGGHDAVTIAADADAILSLATQEIGLDVQNANTVFAGPTSGAAADPTFRALVTADMPDLSGTYQTVLTNEAGLYSALNDVSQFYEPGDTIQTNSGTTLPATCTTGEMFLDTDADTNGSLYTCVSTNTWKEVDDDGGAGGGAPTDAHYYVNQADATLSAEVVITGIESANGILKGNGSGTISAASAGTDYALPTRKLDDFGTPDDNTDLNATTTYHGLLPKLDNNSAHYLNGQGSWATPAGGGNVSTSGTPVANDYARFTDSSTIEGRSYAEVRSDLDLEAGTDFYSKSAEDTWRNSTTQTEMGYLHGVTSDIQTQIDAKEDTLTNSSGLASALSDETGTGSAVFSNSPTLVTPTLGVAAATSLNTGHGDNELYAMDQDVQTSDSPTFAGISVTASATPGWTFSDSDTSAVGTGTINVDAATAGYDSQLILQVDDSAGEDTTYITIDGSAEEVSVTKDINLSSGKVYKINSAQINIGDLAAGGDWTPTGTIDLSSTTDTVFKANTIDEPALNVTNSPVDNYILSYNSAGSNFTWVEQSAGGGDNVSVDSSATVDPDFVSTGDIDFVNTSNTITANINAGAIDEPALNVTNSPVDNYVLSYNAAGSNFTWVEANAGGGDNVSVDSSATVDPDFVSTGDIDFVNTSNTITANINAGAIVNADVNASAAIAGSKLDLSAPGAIGGTTPNAISGTTGTFTGTLSGKIGVTSDTAATVDLSTASNARGQMRINGDDDPIDYTLPPAEAGLNICFYSGYAQVVTVDVDDAADTIVLDGAALSPGNAIDSAGGAGDFICMMAIDSTYWITLGRSGTWVNGGAD